MSTESNAGERDEDKFDEAAPTAAEIEAAQALQDIADGHRYMPQDMRDARDAEAAGKKPERPKKPAKSLKDGADKASGERIAKVLARAGLASRREVERLIGLGRIAVNGRILETPAVLVKATDVITVEGQVIGKAEPTRLFRYHKPVGLLTTERDPEGRPTVFDKLPAGLPRVLKVGRLDINSEGLLLLTNDGELARALELPSSGWVRRYRARALGHTTQARLDSLRDGTTVDGVIYGPIEATLDKMQEKADGRANAWITVAITEGKNREVRRVLESLGLKVNRLIRLAYGPFQLGNLEPGEVEEIGPRVIRELLGDLISVRNLPPENASQTAARPRPRAFERGDAPEGRRGGGDRFAGGDRAKMGDKPRSKRAAAEKREFKPRDFDERPRFESDGPPRDRRPGDDGRPGGDRPRRDAGKPAYAKTSYAPRAGGEGERKAYGKPKGDRPDFRPRAPAAGEAGAYERARREFGPSAEKPAYKKPYVAREGGGDGSERRAYMKPNREGAERPAGGYKKPYAAREDSGERKSYGDRPRRDSGDRPQGAERPAGGYKKPYAARPSGGDRPAGSYKKPYGAREDGGARPSHGDRPRPAAAGYKREGEARGPKREWAPREGGERKPHGDKPRGAPRSGPGGFKGKPAPRKPRGE